jgi:nucleoside-diphosphate-sugar epimerase
VTAENPTGTGGAAGSGAEDHGTEGGGVGADRPRRVVVIGASGNLGTGVLRALASHHPDTQVVGVCRRPPTTDAHGAGESDAGVLAGVQWHRVDLGSPTATADLMPVLRGADAVVHVGWAIQPVRKEEQLDLVNIQGTRALLRAIAAQGVGQLVYASSLGVYAPGATAPVVESWPDSGQRTSVYSRQKVVIERMLDKFEHDNPTVAVARIRPTLVVQRDAATEIRSLFLGPLVPRPVLALLRRGALPILPLPDGLVLQFVHADDVGDAVVRILDRRAIGSFNLAADALDSTHLAALLGARAIPVPPRSVRAAVVALYRLHAVPVSPGWYDVAMNTPVMDTSRARDELGWVPVHTSTEGARQLIDGLAEGAVGPTAAMGA